MDDGGITHTISPYQSTMVTPAKSYLSVRIYRVIVYIYINKESIIFSIINIIAPYNEDEKN